MSGWSCAALTALLSMSAAASAEVLFSTYNTSYPDELGLFDNMNGAPYVSGADSWALQQSHLANGFVLPASGATTYTIDSVSLAASLVDGPNEIRVALMTSENGLPDDVLWQTTLSDALQQYSGTVLSIAVTSPVNLHSGELYFLAAFPGQTTTAAGWHYAYQPVVTYDPLTEFYDVHDVWPTGVVAWNSGSGWQLAEPLEEEMQGMPPNNALGAFSISGTALPEPSTVSVVIIISAAMLARRRAAQP